MCSVCSSDQRKFAHLSVDTLKISSNIVYIYVFLVRKFKIIYTFIQHVLLTLIKSNSKKFK